MNTGQKHRPTDDRYPARDLEAPRGTVYTATRETLLNSAILLRLGELPDDALRHANGRIVVWLRVRDLETDAITVEGVRLLSQDASAAERTDLERNGFKPILGLGGLDAHARYLRESLGIALPMESERCTRAELLAVLASHLQAVSPLTTADDAFGQTIGRPLTATRYRGRGKCVH